MEVTIERAYRDRVRPWIALGYGLRLRRIVAYLGEGKYDDRFGDMVHGALSLSSISAQEAEDLWNFHTTVLRGQIPESHSTAFAVVDVALIISDSHIDGVAARAAILSRMVSEPVIAAIVGAFICDDSLREFAEERDVGLIPTSMVDAKLYRYFRDDVLEELYGGKIKL